MGEIAKNKIEELKSNRIYIEGEEYLVSELENQYVSFEEEGYNVEIYIKPLLENIEIHYVNVIVSKEKVDSIYNIIRYINFSKTTLSPIHEEAPIDPGYFNY